MRMCLLLLSWTICLGTSEEPDTLVVCPEPFVPAMRRWVDYREMQGHRFRFVSHTLTANDISREVRHMASRGRLKYLLLVGDAEAVDAARSRSQQRTTPTHYAAAEVNILWGSEPELATDSPFADLDDDQIPDLAVGRLPADSAEDLAVMLDKVIDYETRPRSGNWRRRLCFVAGGGGLGPILDTIIEASARKILTSEIPPAYVTSMTYGNWRSPFCPDPRRFREETLARWSEGSLFWVYLGHARPQLLAPVNAPDGTPYGVLGVDDVSQLRLVGGAPIAVFLSCYTGAYDASQDCLAEELLRSPNGPVAVLCGSRVTMPYGMSVLGHELMQQYFHARRESIGEVVLHAKRRMAESRDLQQPGILDTRYALDALATLFGSTPDRLLAERLEHVRLFNLLGDPLLRLPHPREIRLQAEEPIRAGQPLIVTGETDIEGYLTLELARRRDDSSISPPRRRQPQSADEWAAFTEVYARANDDRWSGVAFPCSSGAFRGELTVPNDACGPCYVRAFVEGDGVYALGAREVSLQPVRSPDTIAGRGASVAPRLARRNELQHAEESTTKNAGPQDRSAGTPLRADQQRANTATEPGRRN